MRNDTHKSGQAQEIRRDAEGQFAPSQADGKNNGVADAKPRVINPSEDATIHNRPPEPGKMTGKTKVGSRTRKA
jgi:hypothetical protein